ncbi:peptidylprolyl isomerase [Tumebacillus permanentifrigoris]
MTALLSTALVATLLTGCSRADSPTQDSTGGTTTAPKSTDSGTKQDTNTTDTTSKNNKYSKAPEMKIDKAKDYTAVMDTNKGTVKIHLFADKAPLTVNNFVFLARDHFYDGIKFHRIVKTFMIQTGDPLGVGTGGPGYKFNDELPPSKEYGPGIVAMANAGPNTNGSQFFIGSGEDVKSLNRSPNYTVFGEVTEGMDVVTAIANTPVAVSGSGEMSKPKEDIVIKSVEIVEK